MTHGWKSGEEIMDLGRLGVGRGLPISKHMHQVLKVLINTKMPQTQQNNIGFV